MLSPSLPACGCKPQCIVRALSSVRRLPDTVENLLPVHPLSNLLDAIELLELTHRLWEMRCQDRTLRVIEHHVRLATFRVRECNAKLMQCLTTRPVRPLAGALVHNGVASCHFERHGDRFALVSEQCPGKLARAQVRSSVLMELIANLHSLLQKASLNGLTTNAIHIRYRHRFRQTESLHTHEASLSGRL